jgi:hypothetical protein
MRLRQEKTAGSQRSHRPLDQWAHLNCRVDTSHLSLLAVKCRLVAERAVRSRRAQDKSTGCRADRLAIDQHGAGIGYSVLLEHGTKRHFLSTLVYS